MRPTKESPSRIADPPLIPTRTRTGVTQPPRGALNARRERKRRGRLREHHEEPVTEEDRLVATVLARQLAHDRVVLGQQCREAPVAQALGER